MDAMARQLFKGLIISILVLSLNLAMASVVFCDTNDNVPRTTVQQLKAMMDRGDDIVIIDVRSGWEYAGSKIKVKGAIRIPLNELEGSRYHELPQDKEIITYCT